MGSITSARGPNERPHHMSVTAAPVDTYVIVSTARYMALECRDSFSRAFSRNLPAYTVNKAVVNYVEQIMRVNEAVTVRFLQSKWCKG
jgi:hypothetical protein